MQSPHTSSMLTPPVKTPGTLFTPSTPISIGDAKKLAEEVIQRFLFKEFKFNILPLVLNVVEKIRDSTSGRDDNNIIIAVKLHLFVFIY